MSGDYSTVFTEKNISRDIVCEKMRAVVGGMGFGEGGVGGESLRERCGWVGGNGEVGKAIDKL